MTRNRIASLTALLLLAALPAAAAVLPHDAGLRATVNGARFVAAGERPVVTVTIANDGPADVYLLRWQTPFTGVFGNIFDLRRDGQPVAYTGALYKFAAPTADDYIRVAAGSERSVKVDLSRLYDFDRSGEYTVQYRVALQDALRDAAPVAIGAFAQLASPVAFMAVERDKSVSRFARALKPSPPPAAGTNAFVKCDATQQTAIAKARTDASNYAGGAISYLNTTFDKVSTRYTTWFGAKDSGRFSTVKAHYPPIKNVFDTQGMTFYCNCHQKNTYAYVYPDRHYEVHLCGAFWSAPAIGTDSKAGTLVHETSHFDNVASTDDWAYGQSACKSLALSNPTKAIDNADSHEYFAENNPALP